MKMKLFCAVIAITAISTTVQAAETCHPGYYCVRMFEAPAEDPNVAWAREENARQRVEAERSSALRRERIDRLDSEWNAYLATEAARRSPSPQSITVIDSRGNAFFGTVYP